MRRSNGLPAPAAVAAVVVRSTGLISSASMLSHISVNVWSISSSSAFCLRASSVVVVDVVAAVPPPIELPIVRFRWFSLFYSQ